MSTQRTRASETEINRAREDYGSDDIVIDTNAFSSQTDDGVWVSAWVWLSNEEGDQS